MQKVPQTAGFPAYFRNGATMQEILYIGRFLTSAQCREAVFLTLILCCFPVHSTQASDDEASAAQVTNEAGYSLVDEVDKGHRMALLLNYVRQQMPNIAPGLEEDLRRPLSWMRSISHPFDSGDDDAGGNSGGGFLARFMQPPSAETGEAMWVLPGYHHKGFLPFHDAMMTGMNFRERAFGDRMQFDLKPFYGQNWVSLNGYGGAQLGIGLTHPGESQPWGRIALGYIDGASYLMDNGRGFNLSAELRFDPNLSLVSGVRNDTNTDLGNYAIMRWKLARFGP